MKLFALEDDSDNKDHLKDNELLIDKVLNYSKQSEKSPMSLTADVLNQRQQLKKEINEQLNQEPEDGGNDDSGDNSGDNNDDNQANGDDNADNDDNSNGENSGESKDQKKDGDDGDAADDKDALNSLVGSGLKEDGGDNKEGKDQPATESRVLKTSLSKIFTPLQQQYAQYSASLESFNLGGFKLSMEQQAIVYVKEPVKESLNALVNHAANYIANNNTFVEKNAVAVKDINEKISIFRQFVENAKFHFTNALISDKDILSNVACPEKSDIVETARILLNYIEDSTKSNGLLINNEFEKLSSAYTNQNFHVEENDLVYKTVLPGFNIVRVHLEQYRDYIKTNIQEYQHYKLKVLKTEDLYNLSAITITEDRDLNRLLDILDKLIVNISLTTDNLKDINTHFTKFIDDIKVVVFDLDKDKFKDLASINIDSKVKDFIKFKLVIESSYININMMIEYLVNVMTVLNQVVELKD